MTDPAYCGRFAPSPTGPLHFGSLVAALGSFLQARSRGGCWRVRMEDLDPPRAVTGAADLILRTLERYGLHWDGPVVYQSGRTEAYRAALADLERHGLAYPCTCSRKALAAFGGVYPGTCRRGAGRRRRDAAMRVLTTSEPIGCVDRMQGACVQALEGAVGDFVVRRRDGHFAYQLAVVVDDAAQGITEVVRGSDLLTSTPRQVHLQRLLGLATPAYLHLPLALDARGDKLSKQTRATPLDPAAPVPALRAALAFLGQDPDPGLSEGEPEEVLRWASGHWQIERVPRRLGIPWAPSGARPWARG